MREGCSGTPADEHMAPPLGASPWERTLFDHLPHTHRPGTRNYLRSTLGPQRMHPVEGACISHQLPSSTMSVVITACSCSLHYR